MGTLNARTDQNRRDSPDTIGAFGFHGLFVLSGMHVADTTSVMLDVKLDS
ncbi:MAG: hypothetical protein AAGA55_07800 [Planctomycetota bacterium]